MTSADRVRRAGFCVCVVLAGAHTASFLGMALVRLGYPYDLEWMEGGCLLHSRELLLGRGLYRPPSADFISFPYEPLYPMVVAALARPFGLSFAVARMVSILSTLVVALLVGSAVRHETDSRKLAFLAGGTVFSLYRATGFWFDVGRVDMLFLALLFGGLYAARYLEGPLLGAVTSAVLLFLSYKTKQLALPFFLLVPPLLYPRNRRAALAFLPAVGALLAGVYLWSQKASGGWYWFYVNEVARGQPYDTGDFVWIWKDFLSDVPVLIVFAIAGVHSVFRSRPFLDRARQVWPLATGLGFAATMVAWARPGGWTNNFLTTYVPLIVPAFVGVRHFQIKGSPWERALVYPLLALQLLVLGYDPTAHVPTLAEREAGQKLVELLRAAPGPVLVPEWPWLAVIAGKEPSYQTDSVWDLSYRRPKTPIVDLDERLTANYYSLVLLVTDPHKAPPPNRLWPDSLLRNYHCDRYVELPIRSPPAFLHRMPSVICRYAGNHG
jgi:hypothetical protein